MTSSRGPWSGWRGIYRSGVDVTATLGYQQAISAGTGMVLTPSGLAITNNHVIEGATSITVTDVGNRRTYQATVAGYDQSQDIAVLRLAAAAGLKTVSMGNSSAVHIGAIALLGVSVLSYGVPVPGQPASTGAGVVEVTAGTPAAAAGLAPGDVIVSLGGHAVTSAAGLRSAIDAYHPGNKTSVAWADLAGHTHTAAVVFATGPAG